MIEALVCGTPVAAFPIAGALDIVGAEGRGGGANRIGALDEDLASAIALALTAARDDCVAAASNYSWDRCTDQFLRALCLGATSAAAA